MICHPCVHWNHDDSNLSLDINLNKSSILKVDIYDIVGKCVLHLFEKPLEAGHFNIIKKIKKIATGAYTLKISTKEEGCNVVRFMVD